MFGILLVSVFILLTACELTGIPRQESVPEQSASREANTSLPDVPANPLETSPKTEEQQQKTFEQTCLVTSNCPEELECINGNCQTLAPLYKSSDCSATCKIAMVKLTTSDGEDYEIRAGQGGYTAAGALAWKILSTPNYCQGEQPLVPIKFTRKTTGKILSEEIVTLHQGETTLVIDHPIIPKVRFTITVKDVEEECE